MCLVLIKCYNQKVLSNHPLNICPFSSISDGNLKFKYLKPQADICKCKINIEEILLLFKFFLKLIDLCRDSSVQILNVIVAQQTRNFFVAFFVFNQGIILRSLTSFPWISFSFHPTSSIQSSVHWFVYIYLIRLN